MVAVLAKVFHLSRHEWVWERTGRRFGGEQFFEALDQAMFPVVAQLVQERFHPWAGFSGAWMEVARQFPEILARVVEVERLGGGGKAILDQAPDPDRAIGDDKDFLGSGQAAPERFLLDGSAELQGLGPRRAGHHVFLMSSRARRHFRPAPPAGK